MRIGIVGWSGHANAGDERMNYCLHEMLKGHDLVSTDRYSLKTLTRCDLVIIGGGSLIVRGIDEWMPYLEKITCPVVGLGLAVDAVHGDNSKYREWLLDRAEFIQVRDSASKAKLGNNPRIIVGPDLTFLFPYETSRWVGENCGLNLRPWPYWQAEFRSPKEAFLKHIDSNWPSFRKHYPFAKWNPAESVAQVKEAFASTVPLSLYAEKGQMTDADVLDEFYSELNRQWDPNELAGCKYLVAMRLHALIFATQMGIPFVSLSYQPKNVEFCRAVGVPQADVGIFNLKSLSPALDLLKTEGRDRRERLLEYTRDSHTLITQQVTDLLGRVVK